MNIKILVVIISVFNLFCLSAQAQNIVFVPEYSTQTVDSLQASPAIQMIYRQPSAQVAPANAANHQFSRQDNVFIADTNFIDTPQAAAPAPRIETPAVPTASNQQAVQNTTTTPAESNTPDTQQNNTTPASNNAENNQQARRSIDYYMPRLNLSQEQIIAAQEIRNSIRQSKRDIRREMNRLRNEENNIDANSLIDFEKILNGEQKNAFYRMKQGENVRLSSDGTLIEPTPSPQ